jgi:hypothetical protein
MARLLEDLRFFIGAFFFVVGVLLTLQGFLAAPTEGYNLNLSTGAAFVIFALFPLTMAFRALSR